jgi:cbb3-type cytochrome oxidase subunit 3
MSTLYFALVVLVLIFLTGACEYWLYRDRREHRGIYDEELKWTYRERRIGRG